MPSADEWWAGLTYDRKEQLYRWIEGLRGGSFAAHPPTKGQMELLPDTEIQDDDDD